MSEVDMYQHKCIGIVDCPSSYSTVTGKVEPTGNSIVALYRLDEDAIEWNAKKGDLLLGGGSGESAALRISIPLAIRVFTHEGWTDFESYDDIYRAYWGMNDAFILGEGYLKLGWNPQFGIEAWLTQHIISFILREYPAEYEKYRGPIKPEQDGSICRLPNPDSRETLL